MLEIGTYSRTMKKWRNWVGTDRWIAFVAQDGSSLIYRRDESGAVTGQPLEA